MRKEKMVKAGIAAAASVCLIAVAVTTDLTWLPSGTIVYKQVDAPTPANEDGIVTADEWAAVYPEIAASMKANADNDYRVDYLEEDPYLVTIYDGFGFAKDYTSAIGHSYTLEDVHETARPHALANCLTCKTPDFTKLVNDMGKDAYKLDFEETWAQMDESVSCYNCHENQAGNAGELVVTHSYVKEALGDNMNGIAAANLACGQCHIEYYFEPDTKATAMPYDSVEAMDPEAILAYYDEMGFSDWTQESTGTGLLKAQHPEFETVMNGSAHANFLNCASCHMEKVTEGKVTYTSHRWMSPLESQAILDTCVECHGDTDIAEKVHAIQEEVTGREKEVGEKLAQLKTGLAEKVAEGKASEKELNEIRSLYRSAQWYWDFCYVENSEGAHNSALAKRCLDTSEGLIDEAMKLL